MRASTAGLVALLALSLLPPASAGAQSWEVELARVAIDHDPGRGAVESGEQIPAGWGLRGRLAGGSGAFLEVEVSRGAERRRGAVCGGFIPDPSFCVSEQVRYSGGLAALLFGWRLRQPLGSGWSVGLRPRAGVGVSWVRERGDETGRTFDQGPLTFVLGAAVEGRYRLPGRGLALLGSVGWDQLRPRVEEGCADCWLVLRDPMPQWSFSLGMAWEGW